MITHVRCELNESFLTELGEICDCIYELSEIVNWYKGDT